MSMFSITGGFAGLAVSSRVRLARNLKGYPFRLTEAQHQEIADKVFSVLQSNPTIGPAFEKIQIIPRSTEASQLVEEHLISPELAQNGGWLIVSKDKGVAIMVGEEDHLRLQVIGAGLCPKECLETAERVATLIEAALPFAYDEHLGYLTACPTNVGTGLRASIMLHLPMLTATGAISHIVGYAGSRGCAVRGAYGEGSKAVGGFYQISNQVTLGASSAELTDRLVETATTIIDAEKKAREQVRSQNEAGLRDRIYRAAGTMRSAYLIDTAEAIQCVSDVLVGLQMGLLSGVDPQTLYALEQHIRPAMLTGAPQERDIKRAAMLRETAKDIIING
nr:ATP--guanido phosphotransferase [uncultured Agathobaculum sp.]